MKNKEQKVLLLNEMLLYLTIESQHEHGFNELSQTMEEVLVHLFETMSHDQLNFVINSFYNCFRMQGNISKYKNCINM